jgi:hypothetical protein
MLLNHLGQFGSGGIPMSPLLHPKTRNTGAILGTPVPGLGFISSQQPRIA